jgi:uncharacterized protein
MKDLTPAEAAKPRSRRLRKKLRVGEFQALGFSIEVRLTPDAEPTFDQALDAWIEVVESHGWAFGGGGSVDWRSFGGFVASAGRGTLTEDDRQAAEAWLRETPWVEGGEVGLLRDAWHGW